jgi:hypothetical protein
VSDYDLWAAARLSILDQDRRRPLSPLDLNSKELREWQHALDRSDTIDEATMVVSR